MVESSDLQSAIQRTQATERVQALQNQQEELERKRFELSIARERAEKAKKAQDVDRAAYKRVVRDRYDADEEQHPHGDRPESDPDGGPDGDATEADPGRHEAGPGTEGMGGIDVRV